MTTGFKKDDRVVHPNVPQVLRISSISGAFAILRTDDEGYSVGQFPLSELQLASGPKAAIRAGDIIVHEGREARVDRVNNCKLWVEDSRKVHIVDEYQVRRAPIDVGNWVRVCETGLVGMVTRRDPSYVRAFEVAGEAYHERELVRTTEPGIAARVSARPKTAALSNDIQVNDILLYRSLPDNEFAIKEVRVDRIIDNTFLLEGERGRIYGCREPSNLLRAPIRADDWVRTPNGSIWVTPERIEQDGLRVSGDFYPWAVVHRIARPVLQAPTWQGPSEADEERPLTRKASRIPFGEEAMCQLEELQGHFGAQQSSPSMIEATNKVESQIVAMRDRLARLRNMDAKLQYHLNGRVNSKLPWSMDGNMVSIYVSRDIDLEDFVARYANFREVAPPEFHYVVQYAETKTE